MSDNYRFTGFPRECVRFYADLARNNEKAWFETHRGDYERFVLEPARAFVSEMGERLRIIAPGVHADPRIDKSIFRLHKDTRFARDKKPYKTHLAIWFWEGHLPRVECSGFYLQLEPGKLFLGAGIYIFSRPMLEEYRDSVIHPKYGDQLARAIASVSTQKRYSISGKHYRRVPRGYDSEHKYAELLLHNGLHASVETKVPKALHSGRFLDYCFERFSDMRPIHKWLYAVSERVA